MFLVPFQNIVMAHINEEDDGAILIAPDDADVHIDTTLEDI
jgi:hypothetical protein